VTDMIVADAVVSGLRQLLRILMMCRRLRGKATAGVERIIVLILVR